MISTFISRNFSFQVIINDNMMSTYIYYLRRVWHFHGAVGIHQRSLTLAQSWNRYVGNEKMVGMLIIWTRVSWNLGEKWPTYTNYLPRRAKNSVWYFHGDEGIHQQSLTLAQWWNRFIGNAKMLNKGKLEFGSKVTYLGRWAKWLSFELDFRVPCIDDFDCVMCLDWWLMF